ncbi:MAG TPA: TPM domain-containing protein [Brevundimonas sp.]|jgi:putative membrane protein|uniref:TPM domain-containing protein n=1 Tax=Brevundimonas sp. TaxID=1871086 RepID=UPI002E0E8BA2|nr:TPM domain-containing protein [Brevundimonas sp.]
MRVSEQDQARIAAAIVEAERSTSGEIFCVLARRAAGWQDVALAWAAAAALILPLGLIPLGFDAAWFPGMGENWEAAHTAARDVTIGRTLAAYGIAQAAVFLAVLLALQLPGLRRIMVPGPLRRARVHRAAMEQFLAHGIHVTEQRTGVLIYAALEEHVVEVVADRGIYSRVDPAIWSEVIEQLARRLKQGRAGDGFVEAVSRCGAVLAEHFPPGARNPDELPNHLIQL